LTSSEKAPAVAQRTAAPPQGRVGRSDPVRPRRRIRHGRAVVGLLAPFAVLFAAFYLVPIGYAIVESLYTVTRVGGTFGRVTEVFGGFVQYAAVFSSGPFWASIGRVLVFFLISIPLQLGLALVFALLLDSPVLRGARFFRLAFFVPYAVPGVIAAIMWGFLYAPTLSPFTLLTTSFDLLGPDLVIFSIANIVNWIFTGYNMLIVYAALQAIPPELTEAARMDGAGQWRIAWSIKIPMVRPALGLTGVFAIIGTLQLFNEPLVMRSVSSAVGSDYTPNMVVYATANIPNYNLAAAFSVVLALVTCVLSFTFLKFAQRRTVE
jgi:multiple sugar transport system permease protein